MEKIRTLEEFAIREIEDLRAKNICLENQLDAYEENFAIQEENIEFWKNSYYTLIEKIKKDFQVQLKVSLDKEKEPYIYAQNYIWSSYSKEEYKYYKNVFNLKEEGEEENEQSNSN